MELIQNCNEVFVAYLSNSWSWVLTGEQQQLRLATLTNTYLLEGLRDSGNRTIWQEFDQRYRPLVIGYAQRAFGLSYSLADEAAQETMIAFCSEYRKGKYDRDRGRLRKWLFGIATRQIKQLIKKRARIKEVNADSGSTTGIIERFPDDSSAEKTWAEGWRQAVFEKSLEEVRPRFDEKTVRAFVLFAREGWPAKKVAKELGMAEGAVFVAKHRIIKAIRELTQHMEEIF